MLKRNNRSNIYFTWVFPNYWKPDMNIETKYISIYVCSFFRNMLLMLYDYINYVYYNWASVCLCVCLSSWCRNWHSQGKDWRNQSSPSYSKWKWSFTNEVSPNIVCQMNAIKKKKFSSPPKRFAKKNIAG